MLLQVKSELRLKEFNLTLIQILCSRHKNFFPSITKFMLKHQHKQKIINFNHEIHISSPPVTNKGVPHATAYSSTQSVNCIYIIVLFGKCFEFKPHNPLLTVYIMLSQYYLGDISNLKPASPILLNYSIDTFTGDSKQVRAPRWFVQVIYSLPMTSF